MMIPRLPRIILATLALPLLAVASPTNIDFPARKDAARTRESFNTGWTFARFGMQADGSVKPEPAALKEMASPDFTLADWRKLNLPHDWGIEGPFRQDLPGNTGKLPWQGIGWYRKSFNIPASDQGKRLFLDIDGAMSHAKVWLNGHEIEAPPYGYTSFRLDLTPHLVFGGQNTIAIRLDTEKWDSRWYPGAGIYRHTWLVKTAPIHIANEGTTITTPTISESSATAHVAARVENQSQTPTQTTVQVDILELSKDDSIGTKVASQTAPPVTVAPGATAESSLTLTVANPKLWDLASPHRYLARATVLVDGKAVDHYDTPFGFRTLKFTARDGFYLNGKRTEIRGVCMHQDLGALGVALNNRALERQMETLLAMGCNAIRTSHNPPCNEILDMADRMGMLIQSESFDCWEDGKHPNDYNLLFAKWHDFDLRSLIRRCRNHPSVFMWSIGNEVKKEQRQTKNVRLLSDIIRSEDTTRPITAGCNNPAGALASGFNQFLDVAGMNYHLETYNKIEKNPAYRDKPYHGSETSSCISSRGEYFFPVKRGKPSQQEFQVSSYDIDSPGWGCTPDAQFKALDTHPSCLGEFVWTGWDYLGEPTPYNADQTNLLNFSNDPAKRAALTKELENLEKIPVPSRSSYFGIIDLAGFPKDRFYAYQARWKPDLPMVHLFPHWNWHERIGEVTPVHAYSSGDEAELFLNGQSLGRRKKSTGVYRFQWDDVKYQPGELKIVAYKNGKPWAEQTLRTTSEASALSLEADRPTITGDGNDLCFVTLRVIDKNGDTVPRSKPTVRFTIDGPGEIVATDNGDATDLNIFSQPQRKAFNGLALAIVRATRGTSGQIHLKAEADGLTPATLTIQSKARN